MNIESIKDCYGCGVCATVCPRDIIGISLNVLGFYEPVILDSSQCIDCGLCCEVCSYLHDELSLQKVEIQSCAAWSKEKAVRQKETVFACVSCVRHCTLDHIHESEPNCTASYIG